MRTAEEIIIELCKLQRPINEELLFTYEILESAIKEAHKDVVEYVASLCTINDNNHMPDISQAAILKLIDKLK